MSGADRDGPAVSVVMPCFDGADHARGAVASVLAQSLREFEIVLVDDGSGPADAAALDELARPPVRLLRRTSENYDLILRSATGTASRSWTRRWCA